MPQPNNFDLTTPSPTASRLCPVCGEVMFILLIEPTYQNGYDVRTFECVTCAYTEMALTRYDEASGGGQTDAGADTQNETVKDLEPDSSTKENTKAQESS